MAGSSAGRALSLKVETLYNKKIHEYELAKYNEYFIDNTITIAFFSIKVVQDKIIKRKYPGTNFEIYLLDFA